VPVALEHGLGGSLELPGPVQELGPGAASMLAGVARQLDAVDGEHLAADEPLPVADGQDFLEQPRRLGTQGGDEGGDGGEMRLAVAGEGDEGDVFPAGPLDAPRTDDPLAVGEEDDLEQHGRRVGSGAGGIIAIPPVEGRQVQFVVDEVVQRMLEGARQQLPFKVHGQKPRAGVYGLVAGHPQLRLLTGSLEP
jgi:hypothetical protein